MTIRVSGFSPTNGLAEGDAGGRLCEFTTLEGTKVHAANKGRNDVKRMIGGANDHSTEEEDQLRHLEVSPALQPLKLHTMKKGKSTGATDAAHGCGDFDDTALILSGAADTARFNDKGGSNDGGYGHSAAAGCEDGNEHIGVLRGQRTARGCRGAYTAGRRMARARAGARRSAQQIAARRRQHWRIAGGANNRRVL